MTTIVVTLDDGEIDEFVFERETHTIGLGRRASNEVCIPDRSVSAAHARVSVDVGTLWIEDLNSTNGTYVNGQLISRRQLDEGDEVILGKVRIRVLGEAQTAASTLLAGDTADSATTANANAAGAGAGAGAAYSASAESLDESGSSSAPGAMHSNEMADSPVAEVDLSDGSASVSPASKEAHPLDGLDDELSRQPMHELDTPDKTSRGAVIEIKNGKKSGQILPIDKPVTTLGRPGIQIAAIMRKPDGYFLLHLESEDASSRPMLNQSNIGDEPVMLHSGDELNVAGIDVEFVLS